MSDCYHKVCSPMPSGIMTAMVDRESAQAAAEIV